MSTALRRPMTRSRTSQAEIQLHPPSSARAGAQANVNVNTKAKDQRLVQRLDKTPSFSETFRGRLEWKKRHYDKPMTSTPMANSKKSAQARVGTGNLDQIISPISKDEPISIGLEVVKMANRPRPKSVTPPHLNVDSQQFRVPLTPLKTTPDNIVQVQPPSVPQEKLGSDKPELQSKTHAQDKKENNDQQYQGQGVIMKQPAEKLDKVTQLASKSKSTRPRRVVTAKPKTPARADNTQPELLAEPKNIVDIDNPNPNFSHFLELYGESNDHENLRVDRNKIKKTYSRKSDDFIDLDAVRGTRAAKHAKILTTKTKPKCKRGAEKNPKAPKTVTVKAKPHTEKIDRAALEWMEATNKEFENIMNFPLCVEKLN